MNLPKILIKSVFLIQVAIQKKHFFFLLVFVKLVQKASQFASVVLPTAEAETSASDETRHAEKHTPFHSKHRDQR